MELIFGIGALWGQRTDVPGVGPDQFGVLQDNSIDFSFELKELYSQLQFPIDIARGKGKITGKAKRARNFSTLYADRFFGTTAYAAIREGYFVLCSMPPDALFRQAPNVNKATAVALLFFMAGRAPW